MATSAKSIPAVEDTDLDRDDLVEVAEELDIDGHEDMDDQQLLVEVGRRLGEVEDDASATTEADGDDASATTEADGDADGAGEATTSVEDLTRDEIREELRELGLPVSGNKAELAERLEAVRAGERRATETASDATDQASETASDATDQASEAASDAVDEGSEVTPDRDTARDREEYRVEDDPRDDVAPILDLELGPLALDVLGLDVHLNRVHAVVVANPGPKHALLGKLLSHVATVTDSLGLSSVTDKVTDGVESVVDALPSPDMGDAADEDDDEGDEEDDGDDSPGLVRRVGRRVIGAGRGARNLAHHATDAAGSAKDAALDVVTSGGKVAAAKEGRDALKSTKKAGSAAKDAATGSG